MKNPVGSMFFNFDAGRNVSICKINGCQKPELVGKHSSNLEKHIHARHNDEYQLLMTTKIIACKSTTSITENSTSGSVKVIYFTQYR